MENGIGAKMIINFTFNEDIKTHILKDIQDKRRFLWNEEDISDLQDIDIRELMLLHYDLVKLRLITNKQRTVIYSQEVQAALNGQHSVVLKQIIKDLSVGNDVNTRLSRKITKINFQDKLLFDWGINHLHLGTSKISDNSKTAGLITGGADVLYVYITNNKVYMIDIKGHGHFADSDLLEIMNREWHDIFGNRKIKDTNLKDNPSENEIKMLRKNNINSAVELTDGSVLMPDLGYTTTGNSIASSMAVNTMCNTLEKIKLKAHDSIKELKAFILEDTGNEPSIVTIGIYFDDNGFFIYDKISSINLNAFFKEELICLK